MASFFGFFSLLYLTISFLIRGYPVPSIKIICSIGINSWRRGFCSLVKTLAEHHASQCHSSWSYNIISLFSLTAPKPSLWRLNVFKLRDLLPFYNRVKRWIDQRNFTSIWNALPLRKKFYFMYKQLMTAYAIWTTVNFHYMFESHHYIFQEKRTEGIYFLK